jgi:hypothetical protein
LSRLSHGHASRGANFIPAMFIWEGDVEFHFEEAAPLGVRARERTRWTQFSYCFGAIADGRTRLLCGSR